MFGLQCNPSSLKSYSSTLNKVLLLNTRLFICIFLMAATLFSFPFLLLIFSVSPSVMDVYVYNSLL